MLERERRRWAEAETGQLVEEGLSIQDAQLIINELMLLIPVGEDPATYEIPALAFINRAEITDADVIDARADFYVDEDVPSEDKRLLDAVPED